MPASKDPTKKKEDKNQQLIKAAKPADLYGN
jgi:hypothetical protein